MKNFKVVYRHSNEKEWLNDESVEPIVVFIQANSNKEAIEICKQNIIDSTSEIVIANDSDGLVFSNKPKQGIFASSIDTRQYYHGFVVVEE